MSFHKDSRRTSKRGSLVITQEFFLRALGLDDFIFAIRDIRFDLDRQLIKVYVVGEDLPEVPEGNESPEIYIKYILDWPGKQTNE